MAQAAPPPRAGGGGRRSELWITAGFFLALFMLMVNATLALRGTRQILQTERAIAGSHETLRDLAEVRAAIPELESWTRDFLRSGEERFVQSQHETLTRLENHLEALEKRTANNPSQMDRLASLKAQVANRQHDLGQAVALHRQGFKTEARSLVVGQQGQDALHDIQHTVGLMETEEESSLLQSRLEESAAAIQSVVWSMILATLVGIALVCLAYRMAQRDLAGRRQGEQQLREQHAFLQAVLDNIQEGVIACDAQGVLTLVNRFAQEHAGVKDEPVPAAEWTDRHQLYHPGSKTPMSLEEVPLYRALQGECVRNVELTTRGPDGRMVTHLCSAQPLPGAEGGRSGAVVIINDISERKRLEEQLAQAQKLEAIGQLAGGIAHDFNNLLTIINGYGGLLLVQLANEHPARESVEQLLRAGEQAAILTRKLLAFSRRQAVTPEVLDLNIVLTDISRMLRRLIGENIELITELQPNLRLIRADPGQLEQVLMNLAVNARDAMPHGGKLSLRTHNLDVDGDHARAHPGIRPGSYILLEVSDTGVGMTEEVRAHLFEPFFTTKEPGKGTGLGLAIVLGIVQQAGGHIEVASAIGQGSTFRIYLPQAQGATQPTHAKPDEALAPRGHETILIVEDADAVRTLVSHLLRDQGYRVLEAGDGEEALRRYEQSGVHVDLLLTDIVMPRLGGRELVECLAAQQPGLRVLYLSGYAEDAVIRRGAQQMPLLQKPFSAGSLARKVREVLDTEPTASAV